MEFIDFVVENNDFMFDMETFHKIKGTFMGTTFAPHTCLTVGFLEETKLYPVLLPSICAFIKTSFFPIYGRWNYYFTKGHWSTYFLRIT